jgi:hypothetical protein
MLWISSLFEFEVEIESEVELLIRHCENFKRNSWQSRISNNSVMIQ